MTAMRRFRHQRGVAVITALLLTTLAITIVASLFWQQQVQVRSIENQRLQLQKQWILRGALDWASLILRADYNSSGDVDHLGEPWAVPLAETRLDQYVENGRADGEAGEATLSGGIVDAQSRYNLRNLVAADGKPEMREVAVYQQLLASLRLSPALADATATAVAEGLPPAPMASGAPPPPPPSPSGKRPMRFVFLEDLLQIPGYTPAAIEKLKPYVLILPMPTRINANTAPTEVLAAKMATVDTLSKADAPVLVAGRNSAYFKNDGDIKLRLNKELPDGTFTVFSNYFLVNGKVKLGRAGLEVLALIRRDGPTTRIIWIRES